MPHLPTAGTKPTDEISPAQPSAAAGRPEVSAAPPDRPTTAQRRRWLRLSALLLLLVGGILFFPRAFLLPPEKLASSWALFLLDSLCGLGIVLLCITLWRQVLKLYAERRANVLGAKFRTKLVIGALGLSLLPVFFMYIFNQALMNVSLQSWFSQPVTRVQGDTRSLALLLADTLRQRSQAEVSQLLQQTPLLGELRRGLPVQPLLKSWGRLPLARDSFLVVARVHGPILASVRAPAGWRALPPSPRLTPPPAAPAGDSREGGKYTIERRLLPGVRPPTYLAVGTPVPPALLSRMRQLALDQAHYRQLSRLRRQLHRAYTGYLLLLMLVILFAATWFALYLAKLVTVPIEALARATRELSGGNLAHRVEVQAKDELGELVGSFNRMAGELESNRAQIETARGELELANGELERRQQRLEVMLESLPSAVLIANRDGDIERINAATPRLLGERAAQARNCREIFDASTQEDIWRLFRKADRQGAVSGQLEIRREGATLSAAATVSPIPLAGNYGPRSGYIVVLEDLSDLLQMQKLAAWREVAQRIAHEIKNPLTPIRLAAERLERRMARDGAAVPAATAQLARECAAIIAAEAMSLKQLVDAFSDFARFPMAQPRPTDLNNIIAQALRAFEGRLEGIDVRTRLAVLPLLRLDPDGLKRVLVNLIDNAADALRDMPLREILIRTRLVEGMVEIEIADTGHGLRGVDKERLFLPYVSGKGRGTGLGLAIARRIVEEHGGSIRAEDNPPIGTRLIVELPLLAVETAPAVLRKA